MIRLQMRFFSFCLISVSFRLSLCALASICLSFLLSYLFCEQMRFLFLLSGRLASCASFPQPYCPRKERVQT